MDKQASRKGAFFVASEHRLEGRSSRVEKCALGMASQFRQQAHGS